MNKEEGTRKKSSKFLYVFLPMLVTCCITSIFVGWHKTKVCETKKEYFELGMKMYKVISLTDTGQIPKDKINGKTFESSEELDSYLNKLLEETEN